MDESGEFGVKPGSSRHLQIAVLSTEHPRALEKRLRKEKAKLYNAGWPKSLEIKGTTVWGSPHNPQISKAISDRRVQIMQEILQSICSGPVHLLYSIVNKQHISPHLKAAAYGIAYNYFSGNLLCKGYPGSFAGPIELVVDQRSKETHNKDKFDGYIETRLVGDCNHSEYLNISHKESHDVAGLQAVDFMSWALFRHHEHNDSQFLPIVQPRIVLKDDWYTRRR